MNLEPNNNERLLRDKILRHDFPFDERAWAKMEQLLDAKKLPQNPIPITEANSINALPGPSWHGGAVVFFLLFLAGSGITMAVWPRFTRRATESGEMITQTPSVSPDRSSSLYDFDVAFFDKMQKLEPNPDSIFQPNKDTDGGTSWSFDASGNNRLHFGRYSSTSPEVGLSAKQREDVVESYPLANGMETPSDNSLNSGGQAPQDSSSGSSPASVPGTDNGDAPENKNNLPDTLAYLPACWPILSMDTVKTDSLVRPVPEAVHNNMHWERAWILGINANTVDYDPLRLSVLPHAGYMARYKWNERAAIQAELILKYVSGYGLRTEFFDVVPGGSNQLVIENNQLLFFELPVLLKRTYAPGQSWLAGVKPSLNTPLFAYSSNAVINFSTVQRHYTSRDPIRAFDLGITLGWEYRFSRLWSLDVRYNQGLFDLTIDNYYNNSDIHLNSDFQVSLRYFVFKKQKSKKHEPRPLFPKPADRN